MSNIFADDLVLQGDRVTDQKQALSDKTLKINLNSRRIFRLNVLFFLSLCTN